MDLFLSKGFGEKCKLTESALISFINSILVKMTHFAFILVKHQHREPAKSCFYNFQFLRVL